MSSTPAAPVRRVRAPGPGRRRRDGLLAPRPRSAVGHCLPPRSRPWVGRREDMATPRHVPVLLDRVVALLAPALDHHGAVLVDATLGLGGHSEAVLQRLPGARVIGIDRDPAALELAGGRLATFGDRFTGVHAVYDEIPAGAGGPRPRRSRRGAVRPRRLLDAARRARARLRLRRGRAPGHADGRHDRSAPPPTCSTPTPRPSWPGSSRSTARRSSPARSPPRSSASGEVEPFTTSGRLVELLYAEIPAPARRTGGHPAKRTFQALRMEVNDELAVLRRAIPAAIDVDRRRAAASSWSPTTPSRTAWSSRPSPRHPQRACPRTCRSSPRAPSPPSAWSPGAPRRPRAERDRREPPAASVRLRALERAHRHPSRSSVMSSPAVQFRSRMPRVAEAAGRARPAQRRPPTAARERPGCPSCCS